MHGSIGKGFGELAGNGAGLRGLLRFQPVALQHVHEIGVAAEIELIGAVHPRAPLAEQAGERAVKDRGADLGFHVIADQRQAFRLETRPPLGVGSDEHGNAVDEGAAGGEGLLGIPPRRLLRPHRQVADHHVGIGPAQNGGHIGGRLLGFLDHVLEIAADAVHGGAAADGDIGGRHGREDMRIVGPRQHRLGEIPADLAHRDVEGGGEFDVADMVAAEIDMHEAGNPQGRVGVAVERHALHERRRAIAHPDDRHPNLAHRARLPSSCGASRRDARVTPSGTIGCFANGPAPAMQPCHLVTG